ncbi:MAG: chromate transporter [Thermoflavifilum sp.]|nr:chromate transporter [Thermoflavifilum sp.]MCL6515009.1 chromate transporter [Alicyclobacillus sp.]
MSHASPPSRAARLWELFVVTTRLGLTSFGGPIAHLGYFHHEYVHRRRWLDEETYADLVALCQFLPGPASSQVGMAIGIRRAGLWGALVSWLGFTWPSAVLMILFAAGVSHYRVIGAPWLHGLMLAAVAVVSQAVWSMARQLAVGRRRATMAAASAVLLLLVPYAWMQVVVIVVGGVIGRLWLMREVDTGSAAGTGDARAGAGVGGAAAGAQAGDGAREAADDGGGAPHGLTTPPPITPSPCTGTFLLALFALLLVGVPALRWALGAQQGGGWLALWDVFYRAGSLVFGGGHVVLPLLQSALVPTGMVSMNAFLAGYGAAQALPGPLFTLSAYLGYVADAGVGGVIGAVVALIAMFLPGFLLVAGCLPFWATLRARPTWRSALAGVNATVVGILAAALYTPVWTSSVHSPVDFAVALAAFVLLAVWRTPPWAVVLMCALAGQAAAWL